MEEIKSACLKKLRGDPVDGTFFGCVIIFPFQIRQESDWVKPQRFHFAPIDIRSMDAEGYRLAQVRLDASNRLKCH